MCGRSSLHDAPVAVLGRFRLPPVLPGFIPRYNIAPSQEQWTILIGAAGAPEARRVKWGLVPAWAADPAVGNRMANARSDSIAVKPSYQESFRARRCLILADGYYEWATDGKKKIPNFFHFSDNRSFAIAGLWDRWEMGPEPLETCTVITTDASDRVAGVHHRMPALLPLDRAMTWLDRSTSHRNLLELLTPYEDGDLDWHEVSPLVNATVNDSPACIAPFTRVPEPRELTLWDM